jgi:hypothetical protein
LYTALHLQDNLICGRFLAELAQIAGCWLLVDG